MVEWRLEITSFLLEWNSNLFLRGKFSAFVTGRMTVTMLQFRALRMFFAEIIVCSFWLTMIIVASGNNRVSFGKLERDGIVYELMVGST